MKYNNLKRIEIFGDNNTSMSDDSSNVHVDARVGQLQSYLDMRLIKRWVLPLFAKRGITNISVLDVGAGTGRMTKHLCKIANKCVAIEPYLPFFNRLKSYCLQTNVEVHHCTLRDYIEIVTEPFDLVFLSGVLTCHEDEEAVQAFQFIYKLLRPKGLVYIRDFGIESDGRASPPFGTVMRNGNINILRPPEGMGEMARQTGFNCVRWCRPYPINLPQALCIRWPNAATKLFLRISHLKSLFPVWGILAAFNLRRSQSKINYFSYLLQKD